MDGILLFNFLKMLAAAITEICWPIIALAKVSKGFLLIVRYWLLDVAKIILLKIGSFFLSIFFAFSQYSGFLLYFSI